MTSPCPVCMHADFNSGRLGRLKKRTRHAQHMRDATFTFSSALPSIPFLPVRSPHEEQTRNTLQNFQGHALLLRFLLFLSFFAPPAEHLRVLRSADLFPPFSPLLVFASFSTLRRCAVCDHFQFPLSSLLSVWLCSSFLRLSFLQAFRPIRAGMHAWERLARCGSSLLSAQPRRNGHDPRSSQRQPRFRFPSFPVHKKGFRRSWRKKLEPVFFPFRRRARV